jgi:ATP-dependent Clp protease, protease subunit
VSENHEHDQSEEGPDKKGGSVSNQVAGALYKSRIVFLNEPVNDSSAGRVVAQLLALDAEAPGEDITLFVNSPGGSVSSMFLITSVMELISSDVATVCLGHAESAGAVILSMGAKGKRYVGPDASVMIHQPSAGFRGQATDIEITAKEILKLKARLNHLLAGRTGQPLEEIERATERDHFFTGSEAVEYGIADAIMTKEIAAQLRRVSVPAKGADATGKPGVAGPEGPTAKSGAEPVGM